MGVQGLQTFVKEQGLTVSFRLQDTVLIIDGLNLEYELYSAFLKGHDDKAYGGDYTHLTLYIEDFFRGLQECGVQPVVIMDGSFEGDKLKKKKERFDQRLKVARAILHGADTRGEEINSLLSSYMFVQIAKRLGIPVYKSIFEADDIIPQIAVDLRAPILSGDSDFLVENLPAGVINPKSLLSPNLKVQTDSGEKYIACEIYKLQSLQRLFPGLKPELVPIGGAILGNDYLSFEETKRILGKLPRSPVKLRTLRQSQINQVFLWLSSQPSANSVVASLEKLCANPSHGSDGHSLIRCIEGRYLNPTQSSFEAQESLSVGEYFTENRVMLFKPEPGVPEWAHDRLVDELLQKRAISIFRGQVEFFRPLVEDFSLEKSSYETVFELCDAIYGLLRSDDKNPKVVKRFVRSGDERLDASVKPAVETANKPLPLFAEIGSLSQDKRIALFYEILGISPSIQTEIKSMLPSGLSGSTIDQLTTLLLSAIYLCRHYSYDLWLEYFYAQIVNILFMGHFIDNDRLPTVLELNRDEHDKLLKSLKGFDVLPSRVHGYQARIVHQYNAFQNCLNNIIFLAQVLDLADVFHVDLLVSGLQGTFLYNLTLDLASRDKPLFHLTENILGGSSFKYFDVFQTVLNLILTHSNRKFIATDSATANSDIIPVFFQVNKFATGKGDRLLVRGRKGAAASGLSNLADLQRALD